MDLNDRTKIGAPDAVKAALTGHSGKYTDAHDLFYCVHLGEGHWVGVVGDGPNGSYELFSYNEGNLEVSEKGYGQSTVALRDVLNQEVL